MSKFNKLLKGISPILLSSTLILPTLSMTACSKNSGLSATTLFNSALEEFIGNGKDIAGITSIPHPSNDAHMINPPLGYIDHLLPIREYLTDRINTLFGATGVVSDDKCGNIWYEIPASEGFEDYKTVALQAHMDMVWDAQGEALKWDMKTHPIAQPVRDKVDGEEVIHTKDYLTSLGADDGQGMGLILAITKHRDDFKHPKLLCIITTDEETTADGAHYLGVTNHRSYKVLDGVDYLINLDNVTDGEVLINAAGCNGREYCFTDLPGEKINSEDSEDPVSHVYKLDIHGCLGGHSATEIDKGHLNAIQLVNKTLWSISSAMNPPIAPNVRLIDWISDNEDGRTNMIPTSSVVTFACDWDLKDVREHMKTWKEDTIKLYPEETGIDFTLDELTAQWDFKKDNICLPNFTSVKLIDIIRNMFWGAIEHFPDGYPCTSANISPIDLSRVSGGFGFTISTLARFGTHAWDVVMEYYFQELRKSFNEIVDEINEQILDPHEKIPPVESNPLEYFPVWEEVVDNPLRDVCFDAYKKAGVKPRLYKQHGSLECSFFCEHNKSIKQISIGAKVTYEHNVKECLYLKSYKNLAKTLIETLRNCTFEK